VTSCTIPECTFEAPDDGWV